MRKQILGYIVDAGVGPMHMNYMMCLIHSGKATLFSTRREAKTAIRRSTARAKSAAEKRFWAENPPMITPVYPAD